MNRGVKDVGKTAEEIALEEAEKEEKKERRNLLARKRYEKKAKKRYRHKMPQRLVIVPNADKGSWVESWDKPKKRPISLFPHPVRAVFVGNTGMGKSSSMLNMFLHVQASSRPFKKMYVVCCDAGSKEWIHCEPDWISEELPDIDMFDGKDKCILVCDDYDTTKMSKEQQKRLSKLMRYCSTHKNLSIYMSYQSTFHLPSIARRCANVWNIWRPSSDTELRMIGERCGLKPEDIMYIFDNICTHFRDFLTVDLTTNSPCKLRKSIFQPIEMVEESDSE